MTFGEKRFTVNDYCNNCVGCFTCKLDGKWKRGDRTLCEITTINDATEEELDEAIKIINDVIEPENEAIKTDDVVEHPSHYTSGGIECIDAIKASMSSEEYRGFLKSQVIKYVWRYRLKGKPTEDLKKARFYLDRLITESEASEND